MNKAIGETDRRRAKQVAYNEAHGITPATIIKAIDASLVEMYSPEWAVVPEIDDASRATKNLLPAHELPERISALRREMMDAAEKLDYERAAELRDQIKKLERKAFGMDRTRPAPTKAPAGSAGTHASDPSRDRVQVKKPPEAPIRMRPRKGTGASMAAAGASKRPVRQGKLKLVPDDPK